MVACACLGASVALVLFARRRVGGDLEGVRSLLRSGLGVGRTIMATRTERESERQWWMLSSLGG